MKKKYPVIGVIIEIKPETNEILIKHDEIKNFMMAMTMPFYVSDEENISKLSIGDSVHFSLTIDGNNKAYGAIAAATDIGLVNGNAGNGLDDTKEGVLVGDVGAAGNTVLQPGELLIYIV